MQKIWLTQPLTSNISLANTGVIMIAVGKKLSPMHEFEKYSLNIGGLFSKHNVPSEATLPHRKQPLPYVEEVQDLTS